MTRFGILSATGMVSCLLLSQSSAQNSAHNTVEQARNVQTEPIGFSADSIMELPGKKNLRNKINAFAHDGVVSARLEGAATNRNYITHSLLIHDDSGCWQVLNDSAVRVFTNAVHRSKYFLAHALPPTNGYSVSERATLYHGEKCVAVSYTDITGNSLATNYVLFLRKTDLFAVGLQQLHPQSSRLTEIRYENLSIVRSMPPKLFEIPGRLKRILINSPADYAAAITNDLKPHFQEGGINSWMAEKNTAVRSVMVRAAIFGFFFLSVIGLATLSWRVLRKGT
jgi:hypothetical protein